MTANFSAYFVYKDAEKHVYNDALAHIVQAAHDTQEVFDVLEAIYAQNNSFTHRYADLVTKGPQNQRIVKEQAA